MTIVSADVAVIGAGPAGSACALRLADAGIDTLLIEQKHFPRTKGCGEYVNAPAVRLLRELGLADLREHAVPLRGMRLFAHGTANSFPFEDEIWSLPRALLDSVLRERALWLGVRALHGRVYGVREEDAGVTLLVHDAQGEDIRVVAKHAVAADGSRTVMAPQRENREDCRMQRFAVGGHYADRFRLQGWIEMYRSGHRYLALNPLADGKINAMCVVAMDELHSWRANVDDGIRSFSGAVSAGARTLEAGERVGARVSIGPLRSYQRAPVAGRVLLAGDAAAFFDPFTGQGVAFALKTGALAAHAVSGALSGSTTALSTYAAQVAVLTRGRRNVTRFVDTILHQPLLSHVAARQLRASPFLTRKLVHLVAG